MVCLSYSFFKFKNCNKMILASIYDRQKGTKLKYEEVRI